MDKCKDFFFTYNTKSRNIKFYIKSNYLFYFGKAED